MFRRKKATEKKAIDNWPGGFCVVNEKGPEIVLLPPGAQVIPTRPVEEGPELP